MMSFIVFGIFGYSKHPVSALPRVDYPTISVNVQLPGANPETMATSVAAPLERAFATIPGVALMTSRSSASSTNIVMQFDLDRNIDGAALDVQSQITASLRRLPAELPAPPSFRKVNPADAPVLSLTLASPLLPLSTTNEYAEQIFAQQISQIPGVAQVLIFGQQKYAVRIEADPDLASARGLTLNDIRTAVIASNSAAPVGGLRGNTRNMTLTATGQIENAEGYRKMVIAFRNGSPIRLGDVANVVDGVVNDQLAAWYNKDRAIMLAVFRQSDANTVEVVDAIRAKLPSLQAQLPPTVQVNVLNDRSRSIRESVEDVEFTLILSICLVVLVIFLFLKTLSATLIPTLALPVSLIGTCAFMYVFGYSIDNISLLAMTLAVGFVVDDAIVMLENIVRHIEEGMAPFEAALKGSKEIGFTIISITLSLVAVFIPVLMMGGIIGRVFREFAVTISCSILVSGFVSLTLTPMLCARLLKPIDHHAKPGLFTRSVDFVLDGITAGYRIILDLVLKYRLAMLLVTFATFYVSITTFMNIPKGFFPIEDTGYIAGSTETQAGTGFEVSAERQKQLAEIVMKDPAVLTIYIVLGVLYESYIHPITILSGLPSAGLGALWALQFYNLDLSVIAIIGVLLLVGIVKKNAIMMVDFALERRRDGLEALPAIREAAIIRFRPILMTTLAAILGAVPIALGTGAGAELRQPLGIAIVGGLCVSQVLTLFITPVVYYYLDKVDSYISGGKKLNEGAALPGLDDAQPVRHAAE